ncbi:MAG: DUF4279 domain-containing protein [Leptolyngbya sp.]|nr:DUF4279 domain-containing protein [Candidatus Melainabacteria bacterium]
MIDHSDATAEIYFLTAEEGGWNGPVFGKTFKIIMKIEDVFHDCCLYLLDAGHVIHPGDTLTIPVDFLFPEIVLPKIGIGSKFQLVVSKQTIAEGEFKMTRVSIEPSRIHASFRITGADLNPEEITELLKITPTSTKKKGEISILDDNPIPYSLWLLESDAKASNKFKPHLNYLLDSLESKKNILIELKARNYNMSFSLYVLTKHENVEGHIDSETLRRIADLPCNLWFDIYYDLGDEDEDV